MTTPLFFSQTRHSPRLHVALKLWSRLCSCDGGPSGSAKLFADAAREEAEERPNPSLRKSNLPFLENKHTNWDGEERMEDAILRMLVDKYKPLRGGTIRTAEEKLKQTPPPVHLETTEANFNSAHWANEPILPAVEGHKPWLTTYKVPSHAVTSIRLGKFPPPVSARSLDKSLPADDRTRRKEREATRRKEVAGRLTRAKESTLDYRLGFDRSGVPKQIRPNPVSMRGWTSLIEDKIEVCMCALVYLLMADIVSQKARSAGLFSKVSGRGKPLARHIDESNPFIGYT